MTLMVNMQVESHYDVTVARSILLQLGPYLHNPVQCSCYDPPSFDLWQLFTNRSGQGCPLRLSPFPSFSSSMHQTRQRKAHSNGECLSGHSILKSRRNVLAKVSSVSPPQPELVSRHSLIVAGLGGGLLTPESIASPDAPKKLVGSTFIFQAESLDEYVLPQLNIRTFL